MMTSLNLFQSFVVVDVLRPVVKIENDFSVTVRHEAIDCVGRIVALVINEMIDKLIKWIPGNVGLKNHAKDFRLKIPFVVTMTHRPMSMACRRDSPAGRSC